MVGKKAMSIVYRVKTTFKRGVEWSIAEDVRNTNHSLEKKKGKRRRSLGNGRPKEAPRRRHGSTIAEEQVG